MAPKPNLIFGKCTGGTITATFPPDKYTVNDVRSGRLAKRAQKIKEDHLITFEHTSRCSFSGEIFHNLATNLKLIQPRTPSVSAHPKLRPRGHPLSPQSSRPQLCAVVAYFTMRTVFTIPCCIVSCWSEQVDNGKLRLFDSFHQTD